MKLSTLPTIISGFAAIAGVTFAGIQTFKADAPKPEVKVTVALDQSAAVKADMVVAKTTAPVGGVLDQASYSSAMKDAQDQRYAFGDLFDGKPDTFVTMVAPDNELNVLVDFSKSGLRTITAIEYAPPPGASGALATMLDVMVLPEGQLGAYGRPVLSFDLQTSAGRQSFALPEGEPGKGLWLRVAGPDGAGPVSVGDFKVVAAEP